jgi:hypothetical protein
MALPDQSVCDYNYYTDKADATAWCDWGGMPRKVMYPNYTDHRCAEHGRGLGLVYKGRYILVNQCAHPCACGFVAGWQWEP